MEPLLRERHYLDVSPVPKGKRLAVNDLSM